LGDQDISIKAFIQKEPRQSDEMVDIILLTHRVNEGNMNTALAQIEALDVIGDVTRIRVEALS